MKYIYTWLITSSANPENTSLTIKGVLSLGAAYLLQALTLTCGMKILCLAIDGNVLTSMINTTANIAYLVLSLVGAAATLWGLGRKAYLGRWSAPQPAPLPGQ